MEKTRAARRKNRFEEAKRHANSAVELCRRGANEEHHAAALTNSGQVERDLGNIESAIPLYEQAVVIYRNYTNELQIAHTVRHLGDLHLELEQLEIAHSNYEEALGIYRNSKETGELDLAIPAAIPLWQEAKSLYEASKIEPGIEECKQRLEALAG